LGHGDCELPIGRNMKRKWREERGAALIEYAMVLPLVLLLFLGTLEIVRLMTVQQSLRTALQKALPCFSSWGDPNSVNTCNQLDVLFAQELAKNPLAIKVTRLEFTPPPTVLDNMEYGTVFEVQVAAEVTLGFLHPLTGDRTITVRERAWTFANVMPAFMDLSANLQTP
jgi:Flp pilus assembly pilin Flp